MKTIIGYSIVVLGAIFIAVGFNLFLIPHQLLSGGVSGIAMIIGYLFGWNISVLYLIANVPILVWGFFVLGHRFIAMSITAVIVTTWFMQILPEPRVTSSPLLASIFGGVLIGIGTGLALRAGGSSGGFDIVASIIARERDFPLGTALLALNGIVILALGYVKGNWDPALYSMLSIFITTKVLDTIHIRHFKITAFIVTNHSSAIAERLMKLPRGVTIIQTRGAFSLTEREMLMTVATRYELAELGKIIRELDPQAFVNIVPTVAVIGKFQRLK